MRLVRVRERVYRGLCEFLLWTDTSVRLRGAWKFAVAAAATGGEESCVRGDFCLVWGGGVALPEVMGWACKQRVFRGFDGG